MFGISKVIIFFAIIISTILYWTTSNVCRYNFTIEKKTRELNIIADDIYPSLPKAKVYYYEELNCSDVNFTWNLDRVINNLNAISVLIYQELTTDITGNPN